MEQVSLPAMVQAVWAGEGLWRGQGQGGGCGSLGGGGEARGTGVCGALVARVLQQQQVHN